ncbi:hypothetical protein [Laspinema palackyanum]
MNKELKSPILYLQNEPNNKFNLEAHQNLDTEDESLIMELSPMYLE